MQQTTYEQALPYFHRFQARFPSVEALAAAREADILKAWEGLGYYARARNLAKAAQLIAVQGWPKDYAAWLALPGIGPYTAAALASVLDGECVPVVDGNVARVFARYWHLTDDFKDQKCRADLGARLVRWMQGGLCPGDFNQAMMELGALVCTPTQPKCAACPLAPSCAARKAGDAADYPRHAARAALPVRKCNYVVIRDAQGRVLMVRNDAGKLLQGLWDLPTIASKGDYSQVFSHFRLEASIFSSLSTAAQFVDPKSVPITTAARKILS